MRVIKNRGYNFYELLMALSLTFVLLLAGEYRELGFVGFALILVLNFLIMINKGWTINLKSKVTISILLNILLLIVHVVSSVLMQRIYSDTLYSLLIQLMIYMYLLTLVGWGEIPVRFSKVSKIITALFILILIYLYVNDISMLEYSSLFEYQLGILMLPMTCFFILQKDSTKHKMVWIGISLITIYLSTRRGPLLAFIVFLFTYIIWNKLSLSRRRHKGYFFTAITLCITIPFVYVQLSEPSSQLGLYLNQLSVEYTGARLFSGRDVLWPYVIEILKDYPIWGAGIGVSLANFYETSLSTHNLFFFILMQTGVIGLVLFCYMLYCFWMEYFKNKSDHSRIIGSLLIAILVQQTFSLGLLSGKMALALPVWTLIAYGIYKVKGNYINEGQV